MEEGATRSRLMASGDPDVVSSIIVQESSKLAGRDIRPTNYFSDMVFLDDEQHSDRHYDNDNEDTGSSATWRLKERMKTSGVALIVCLNIGIDPPDVVKPNPCATLECWFDPTGTKQKGLEFIGHALQQQYEKWQSKAKYKQCLDPTSDELRRVCINLRKGSRSDRLLLHYNGHGVPKPTKNGELWVFGKYYTHYTPVAICELRGWLGDPAIYVLDCSGAGVLISHLVDNVALKAGAGAGTPGRGSFFDQGGSQFLNTSMSQQHFTMEGPTIVLAACKADEVLPMDPNYPADLFTCCLTTPIDIAIRWFILQNPYSMLDVNPDLAGNIPGKDSDRKTPRGELNWIFTAITDTIAWTTLPSKTFQKMFRQDLLVASLFRDYLLARRIMKSFGCTPQSWPLLPDTTTHHLWQSWDMTLEAFINCNIATQKGSIMVDARNNLSAMQSNLTFFTDQLTAFDLWLDFSTASSEPPEHLPVVLQALLSQTHRLRALHLLKKYLALGPAAVNLSLMVGIYPYILKLLQSPAEDIKQTLITIWASIIGFDASCRSELIREKAQAYFIQFLQSKNAPAAQRCMSAFVLSEICNKHKEGQQTCLHLGLHRACTSTLSQAPLLESSALKQWICLCLFKVCEDFAWAKYLCITEAGHTHLYPLLVDPVPNVRAAAVLALGEIFGASTLSDSIAKGAGNTSAPGSPMRPMKTGSYGSGTPTPLDERARKGSFTSIPEEKNLREAELHLAWQFLDCCTDGSPIVRLEAIYALSKCIVLPAHVACIKIVAKAVMVRNAGKKQKKQTTTPYPESDVFSKTNFSHPWQLLPSDTTEIITMVEEHIAAQAQAAEAEQGSAFSTPGMGDFGTSLGQLGADVSWLHPESQGSQPEDGGRLNLAFPSVLAELERPAPEQEAQGAPSLYSLMATVYVRMWLALTEVQGKDPNAKVANAATAIRCKILLLVAEEEKHTHLIEIQSQNRESTSSSMSQTPPFLKWASAGSLPALGGGDSDMVASIKGRLDLATAQSPGASSSLGAREGGLPTNGDGAGAGIGRSVKFGFAQSGGDYAIGREAGEEGDIRASIRGSIRENGSSAPDLRSLSLDLESISFQSNSYDAAKRLFLQPDIGYDPFEDPLSLEGGNRAYRYAKMMEIFAHQSHVAQNFRDVVLEEKLEVLVADRDRKAKGSADEAQQSRLTAVANLPPSVTKFEEKILLTINHAVMTSLVMFHAYQDILAVSDESSVSIWSLANASRIMDVKNRHTVERGPERDMVRKIHTVETSFAPLAEPRITAMTWINESYNSLLLLGSDDGVVKVWKDTSLSDPQEAFGTPKRPLSHGSSHSIKEGNSKLSQASSVELATAFAALPDIAETSRGSGLLLSWHQSTGTLIAGGNSSTVRIWDLGKEQCVRVFDTGCRTCLTALATTVGGAAPGPMSYPSGDSTGASGSGSQSWTFAGFADGSIAVFDERVQSNGGRVHQARDHSAWVVSAHMRPDAHEVITSSVRGSVKFWDIRALRTYKTLDVQKSALTSMSVHNCAPVIATGSHAQFIKILTFGGEQLGNIIKYHDGFLGQRVGPIASLAFHPHRMMLAASAADCIVSIYATADDTLTHRHDDRHGDN